ncbi:UNVERIFIED_CONTAM: hypothetical protein FKN15_049275 [Acipenser sinensis]
MLQCSTLGARRSALGVRHFSARRSVLGAWRSALGARTSMLRRSALQRSMLGAWCIDATRARTSTFDALRSMPGACEGPTIGLCGVSGPRARRIRLSGQDILWLVCGVPNPHPLPEGKVGSWWAFTLLGAFHTASAPPLSTVTPPVRRLLSRSPSSQLTAGQRYLPRHVRERSRSPAARDPSPHRKRPRWESRSCSRSPHQKGRSRSPRRDRRYRDRSGVAELTSKMSQFMEVMMGQQSLLMSLANVVPPVSHQLPQSTSQLVTLPQPIPVPVPQVQECDVDAVSRDACDGEPLLEEDSAEAELTSQPSEQDVELVLMDTNDPMWSLVERATRHLGVEWPMVEQPRRSLFESPSAQPRQSRMLPAFADFIKVQSTWGTLASAPVTSHKASTFNMQGATDARLASFPPVRRFGEDANAVRTDKGSCMSQQAMQNHRGWKEMLSLHIRKQKEQLSGCTYEKSIDCQRKYYLSARRVINIGASALGATLRRFVLRASTLEDSVLDASALGARHSVHFHRCTHLLCSTLGTRYSVLGASALDARCSAFDTSALDARCSALGARCLALGARHWVLNATAIGARRFGARRTHLRCSALGAQRTHLDASTFVASALDAWCLVNRRYMRTHLDVRRSALNARCLRGTHNKISEQDENAIQMAGDDVDIPEELRRMVDEDTVEEEEKDSILGQIQNIQNMDMDTIKEKAQATFSEMKEAAEQKCTVM